MEMERRLFEQYEKTKKHINYGRQSGQTALMKYTTNSPGIQYLDLSISVRSRMVACQGRCCNS